MKQPKTEISNENLSFTEEKEKELKKEIQLLKKALFKSDKKLKKEKEIRAYWEAKYFKEEEYANGLNVDCKKLNYGQKLLLKIVDSNSRSLQMSANTIKNYAHLFRNKIPGDYSIDLTQNEQELQKVIDLLTSSAHSMKNDLLHSNSINEFLSYQN